MVVIKKELDSQGEPVVEEPSGEPAPVGVAPQDAAGSGGRVEPPAGKEVAVEDMDCRKSESSDSDMELFERTLRDQKAASAPPPPKQREVFDYGY